MAAKKPARTGDAVGAMTDFLQSPAASGFLVSQKLALEATRFWARRMRAYADQMEECARCTNPEEFVAAQQRFLARMQEDYAQETTTMTELVAQARDDAHVNGADRPNA